MYITIYAILTLHDKYAITVFMNCMPTHHNVSDACTQPIEFIDFKDQKVYLNSSRFLQAKEINEYIGAGKVYNGPEISLSAHKILNSEINK